MAKPAGSRCNLACKYCYYLEKSKLYADNPQEVMSDAMLEKFIKEYIAAQTMPQVLFTWHGGETLMRPLSFYKRVIELERKYAGGRQIDNCIQTNGTMLTDEWCEFFRQNNWLVGVSIDGPQEFHDEYRRTRSGKPSFMQVMKGINLLKKHNVEWNALAVVNDFNVNYPLDFYNFFKEIDCHYIQFSPIVERYEPHADGRTLAAVDEKGEGGLLDFSITPKQWGDFLIALFDEWVRNDVGDYYVQLFDTTLANWVGQAPGLCSMAPTCGHAGVIEWNGDIYSCDHFVFPQYKLGNIMEKSIIEMMYSPEQRKFGQNKRLSLPTQCKNCKYLFACNGECPKNRFARTADGEPGLNYFHKAPDSKEFHEELVRKLDQLHLYDCLRANKSLMAWGVEGRVPFLDKKFLDVAMSVNPEDKMCPGKTIEKKILREAFDGMLPDEVLWRQKEQFSDGVGYSWIDALRDNAEKEVTDQMFAERESRFPVNTPVTKEAYYYRSIFEDIFKLPSAVLTVPYGKSVACSTPTAIAWDEKFKNMADPSGRAVTDVHDSAYEMGHKL